MASSSAVGRNRPTSFRTSRSAPRSVCGTRRTRLLPAAGREVPGNPSPPGPLSGSAAGPRLVTRHCATPHPQPVSPHLIVPAALFILQTARRQRPPAAPAGVLPRSGPVSGRRRVALAAPGTGRRGQLADLAGQGVVTAADLPAILLAHRPNPGVVTGLGGGASTRVFATGAQCCGRRPSSSTVRARRQPGLSGGRAARAGMAGGPVSRRERGRLYVQTVSGCRNASA